MGETTIVVPSLIRFGVFEFDPRAGELRKKGARLKLEGQPLQILTVLLETPGQLVTRDELRSKLWPDGMFVDFEHSINTAVRKLRQALDDSADTPRFIETLPRRGYRFIYPVGDNGGERTAAVSARGEHHPYTGIAVVLAVLVMAGIGAANFRQIRDRWFRTPPQIRSLAVLPLENLTGDAEQEYVVDGVHDELVTQIAQVGALTVISRTSVLRYKQTKKSIPEIARELGVEAVIEGTVRRDGDRLRVTAQLIHAASDRHLWARSYERPIRDIAALPNQIAGDVVAALKINLSAREQEELKPGKPVEPAVYAAYVKGKYHLRKWSHDGQWQAIRDFQQAIDLDPTYAPAWAGMGSAYENLGHFLGGKELSQEDARVRARAALERALELDANIRDAHQTLARMKRREGDWEGAAREFQRAREVDPNWLGPETYLLAVGRYDEAVAAARKNAERNPLSYSVQLIHGWSCFMAGRYDESIAQLKKTIQLDPDNQLGHFELAWNYAKKGMLNEAAAECDTATALLRRKQPERSVSECGWVYAKAGRRREALEIAARIPGSQAEAAGGEGEGGDFVLAKIYDALGDRERALSYLGQPANSVVPLSDNPFLSEALKADPRFQDIARKQPGFPAATGALAEVRAKAPPLTATK